MDFHKFPINQSIIRTLLYNGEEKDFCFKRLYLTRISHQIKEEPSEPMLCGKYFETLCLGKSSGYDVTDLPRKKLTKAMIAENAVRKKEGKPLLKGEKFIHQIRIDDQVTRFKALIKKYNILISEFNVQIPIVTVWEQDPDVLLKAELDVFPTTILTLWDQEPELNAAIIDLKLTADIHNEWGEFAYGKPEFLDLIQAKMYHYIVRNINEKLNPGLSELINETVQRLIQSNRILFLLWVFNYKGNSLEDKIIKVEWDKTKEYELHESIRKTVSILNDGESRDWPTNPVYSLCKGCPYSECPDRIKIQII
jgi:hypothetical protein